MDSLTQIVLGAACGEAVLGKKIGNKALLFGAIGGTIPDLDVLVGNLIFSNKIDATLFHRGIMHSVFFAILAALVLGWFSYVIYNRGRRQGVTTNKDWTMLWFWSLFTHPILDSFTPYGTQLFAPFSNYSVAFNTIAVVDLFYTLPFFTAMILVLLYKRSSNKRVFWLKMGLSISSVYILFTIGNKLYIDSVFRKSLEENHIEAFRFSSQPSLFANFLWYGVAETKEAYYVAYYSWFDSKDTVVKFNEISKERALTREQYEDVGRLSKFSNGYFNLSNLDEDNFIYQDLRYPLLDLKDPNTAVFVFKLFKSKERLDMEPMKVDTSKFNQAIYAIWNRLKGI